MATLGEVYPGEIVRVRELLAIYEEHDAVGFGTAAIRVVLEGAEKAQAAGDVIAMIERYQEMEAMS